MNTQHTPGPWRAAWPDIQAHGGIVAELNTIHERGEADARLIAAAPELLTFAYLVAAWLTAPELNRTTLDAVQRQARAAIAKATGTP